MCEPQQFLLRWHRHAATITSILPEILKSGIFADVTLSVDSKSIKAHKIVLSSASEYFLQLFKGLDNAEHAVVIIPQCTFDQITLILEFIYTGHCQVEKNEFSNIYNIAQSLKIRGLSSVEVEDNLMELNNNEQAEIVVNKTNKKNIPQMTPLLNLKQYQQPSNVPKKTIRSDGTETCKCFICGKYLSNQYNLRVHIETHKETYHACVACPHVSRSRDALRKHVSYRHPENYINRKKNKHFTGKSNVTFISPDLENSLSISTPVDEKPGSD